jgi:predicted enzyme related to lactoylglutathione lyase
VHITRRETVPRVVHFELYADDPEQVIKFYQDVFGWKITKWEGAMDYWLISTGAESEPGIDGAIGRRDSDLKCNVIVDVASVDETTQKVLAAGGQVVAPKVSVPGVGYAAYYADTEGVVFGAMESDSAAR